MDFISKYFPQLPLETREKLLSLEPVYSRWNSMINVISRKDMENFMEHHVLHSLAIAWAFSFRAGQKILDVGTGGGFPGIPLAIVFPEAHFSLLDSTGKKIKVVNAVADELGIKNVTTLNKRAETEEGKYDFITARAVTEFTEFVKLTSKNLSGRGKTIDESGIIYLKGGDISGETGKYSDKVKIWNIKDFFQEPFFETKKIIWLPASFL
ncbi:MAG TPA: 16S rRNA (guanine(527)-N(7))-methyltransferase RsmG [Bacteroidales bacterium]|nr:16S rRNA (guanine(527)-N(7))-methyltransferase RsmG [Bacteroidales bacterium]